MNRAYVGHPRVPQRSGKTLTALIDLKRYIRATVNHEFQYNIVSNIPIKFCFNKLEIVKWGFKKWKPFMWVQIVHYDYRAEVIESKADYVDAMCVRKNTIFFIDEAGVWFNQYDWKDIPEQAYDRFNQLGKDNIHLVMTVQNFNYLVPRLKHIVTAVYECCPFPKPDMDTFSTPPSPLWITQQIKATEYYEQKGIRANKDLEGKYLLKTKRLWFMELQRAYGDFDTRRKIYDTNSRLKEVVEEQKKVEVKEPSLVRLPIEESPTTPLIIKAEKSERRYLLREKPPAVGRVVQKYEVPEDKYDIPAYTGENEI